jgi:hypothetical protein
MYLRLCWNLGWGSKLCTGKLCCKTKCLSQKLYLRYCSKYPQFPKFTPQQFWCNHIFFRMISVWNPFLPDCIQYTNENVLTTRQHSTSIHLATENFQFLRRRYNLKFLSNTLKNTINPITLQKSVNIFLFSSFGLAILCWTLTGQLLFVW